MTSKKAIITGIVAEFNPFHNGHKYIIEKARQDTDADYVIVVMSGDFVQRGSAAIMDKHARTMSALKSGVDAVFMLPVAISTASAQYFARGSVKMLADLGCDYLYFGSEDGDIQNIEKLQYIPGSVETPNNILAREYMDAIREYKLNIKAYTTKRIGTDYNDSDSTTGEIASASYIRKQLLSEESEDGGDINQLSPVIPPDSMSIFATYVKTNNLVNDNLFSEILLYKLLSEEKQGFDKYFDVYPDLSSKIISNLYSYKSYNDFANTLKSKDITFSHLKRALCHILLNIVDNDIEIIKKNNYSTYARLLGFRKDNEVIIKILQMRSSIDIITKLSDYYKDCSAESRRLLAKDIFASHLYSHFSNKLREVSHEFTKPLVIV